MPPTVGDLMAASATVSGWIRAATEGLTDVDQRMAAIERLHQDLRAMVRNRGGQRPQVQPEASGEQQPAATEARVVDGVSSTTKLAETAPGATAARQDAPVATEPAATRVTAGEGREDSRAATGRRSDDGRTSESPAVVAERAPPATEFPQETEATRGVELEAPKAAQSEKAEAAPTARTPPEEAPPIEAVLEDPDDERRRKKREEDERKRKQQRKAVLAKKNRGRQR